MVENFLADWTGLSQAQARTLIMLQRISMMNYAIVDQLELFPKSKMRERVLDPLYANGWIRFYRNGLESELSGGRPTLAWALVEERKSELARLIDSAEAVTQHRLNQAIAQSVKLASDLSVPTESPNRHVSNKQTR